MWTCYLTLWVYHLTPCIKRNGPVNLLKPLLIKQKSQMRTETMRRCVYYLETLGHINVTKIWPVTCSKYSPKHWWHNVIKQERRSFNFLCFFLNRITTRPVKNLSLQSAINASYSYILGAFRIKWWIAVLVRVKNRRNNGVNLLSSSALTCTRGQRQYPAAEKRRR